MLWGEAEYHVDLSGAFAHDDVYVFAYTAVRPADMPISPTHTLWRPAGFSITPTTTTLMLRVVIRLLFTAIHRCAPHCMAEVSSHVYTHRQLC